MSEQWKPVLGYEGHYEVSDQGRVRSVDRIVTRSNGTQRRYAGQMLKLLPGRDGRPVVCLRRSSFRVHRLVLEAFVGARPDGLVCCHNDGDFMNNRLSNLRWDSLASNQHDAVRHGTHWNARKTHCSKGHRLDGENVHLRLRNGSWRRDCLPCRTAQSRRAAA